MDTFRVNFIISYSHMWWHFIDQSFWGQTANLIQPFLLVNELGGSILLGRIHFGTH